jgi:hypothetical protein
MGLLLGNDAGGLSNLIMHKILVIHENLCLLMFIITVLSKYILTTDSKIVAIAIRHLFADAPTSLLFHLSKVPFSHRKKM